MQRWLGALLLTCSVGFMTAEAQIVRVGPFGGVRIRAPFASVDVLPYGGGTRVRAPFTAVDTGLYQHGFAIPYYAGRYPVPVYPVDPIFPVPVYPVPIYPSYAYPEIVYPEPSVSPPPPRDAARPIVGVLEDRLRASAVRLNYSLSLRRDDGDVWQNYLAPMSIVDVIDRGDDPRSLRSLLSSYNGVVANPALGSIRNAAGFDETRVLLRQFIERPYTVAPPAQSRPTLPPQAPSADVPAPNIPADNVPADTVPAPNEPAAEDAPELEELPPPPSDAVPTPAPPVAEEARARKPVKL